MTRLAATVPLALAVIALLVGASSGVAGTRVIGGTATQIRSAPWAVLVRQAAPPGSLVCGGSIIDTVHVLTAAHCVYDRNGAVAAASSITVRAGISNYVAPLPDDAEQSRLVAAVRVHPGYPGPIAVSPDDVAVLVLSAPLDLSGPAVQAVSLPSSGLPYPDAAELGVAGYGRESAAPQPDGSLNWLTVTVEGQGKCGGFSNTVIPDYDAVAFCASAANGGVCTGDSGSGLVTTSGTRTIVGVVSAGREACGAGTAIYTNVGAPEILRFVQGEDHPPVAPRRSEATSVTLSWRGTVRAGNTLTCDSAGWGGEPSIAYAFVSSEDGRVLQQGAKPTYRLTTADVGTAVVCRVMVTNEGGTAVLETGATREVGSLPRLGIGRVAPVAAVRGRAVTVRVVLYAPAGLGGRFGVCITPPPQVGSRTCASQRVDDGRFGGFPFRLALRIRPTAPLGSAPIAISAVAGPASGQKTALVRIARSDGG